MLSALAAALARPRRFLRALGLAWRTAPPGLVGGLKQTAYLAEAIVLSCTDMRAVEIIDRLEQALGKPVISSNQAMLFAALELLGLEIELPGFGALLAGTLSQEISTAAPGFD